MWGVLISHLVQRPRPLFALCLGVGLGFCLGVCLPFLDVLVQGGQQLPQPGSGELDKLREEAAKLQEQMSAQNEMIKKLQDQNQDLQSKTDKMQGDLHVCRTESGKHGELVQRLKRSLENYEGQNSHLQKEMSAQNEINKKLQDQNWDLQSKIDIMQGDLHVCRTESGKHGEQVQGLKRNLGDYESQISNLRYSLRNCESQTCKSQDDNIWWLILSFVLGFILGCCLGSCSKLHE